MSKPNNNTPCPVSCPLRGEAHTHNPKPITPIPTDWLPYIADMNVRDSFERLVAEINARLV